MSPTRVVEIHKQPSATVLVVESVTIHHRGTGGRWLHGRVEPLAIVVIGPDATHAFDISADVVNLDQLVRDHPELQSRVACAKRNQR